MKGRKIVDDLQRGKREGKEFIKWWRKENDFTDYELIDQYLDSIESRHEIENYELLDKDEMWDVLKRWKPDGLRRSVSTKGAKIEWEHRDKDGEMKTFECPYNAQSIMSIFDTETRGDTVG